MGSAHWAAWDKRHIWHPFTQQSEWSKREPVIVESARGVWLRDTRGRRLLDGNSSLWVNVFGHRKPALDRAVRRQLAKMSHSTFLGLTHPPAIELAKRLCEIAPPGLTRVFYSDNGSTSVEVALKMAYQYWQLVGHPRKTRFLSLKEAYHGDTLGAVSVGGVELFHDRFKGLLFPRLTVDPARPEGMETLLRRHHENIAAVVLEPLIQGAAGMRLMPPGFLKQTAALCKRFNVLLIADEVATGFGRTGRMFAVEHESVSPDFLCVAKSLTGGYLPLAATLAKEKIYSAFLGRFEEFKAFFHGHTYTANPLACAVALETLKLYREEEILKNVRSRAAQLSAGIESLTRHPHVKEIRQLGLMMGIDLVQHTKRGSPFAPSLRMGLKVCDAALRRGLWLRPLGDTLVVLPPLAISAKEMQFLIAQLKLAFQDTFSSGSF